MLEDAERIANMVLLDQDEQEELRALGWEEWLASRTPFAREWHFLPGPSECEFDDFMSFIEARKRIIQEKLGGLFPDAQEYNFQNEDVAM
jgi:hypothetical protein